MLYEGRRLGNLVYGGIQMLETNLGLKMTHVFAEANKIQFYLFSEKGISDLPEDAVIEMLNKYFPDFSRN